ncbi:hypothetical protein ACWKWA_00960 [Dermacoccus abyssi]
MYGQPLLADEVLLREWCGICLRGLQRVRDRDVDRGDHDRLDHQRRLEDLGRMLAEQ